MEEHNCSYRFTTDLDRRNNKVLGEYPPPNVSFFSEASQRIGGSCLAEAIDNAIDITGKRLFTVRNIESKLSKIRYSRICRQPGFKSGWEHLLDDVKASDFDKFLEEQESR